MTYIYLLNMIMMLGHESPFTPAKNTPIAISTQSKPVAYRYWWAWGYKLAK